jgi:hypothetical protein
MSLIAAFPRLRSGGCSLSTPVRKWTAVP